MDLVLPERVLNEEVVFGPGVQDADNSEHPTHIRLGVAWVRQPKSALCG